MQYESDFKRRLPKKTGIRIQSKLHHATEIEIRRYQNMDSLIRK